MTRSARLVAAALVLVLVAGVVAVLATPLYGVRGDIADQEILLERQLDTVQGQLLVLETSLEVQREGVAEAMRTRELTEQLAVTRELLAVARQTLQEVRQINRKTPDTTP